jgi:hypothetical protein
MRIAPPRRIHAAREKRQTRMSVLQLLVAGGEGFVGGAEERG